MGSLDRGVLTGFICRLCSEMHRIVIHIYGDEGIRLCLSEKISRHLTINVSRSDPLPKTICKNCLERLENQHRLMVVMEQAKIVMKTQQERASNNAIHSASLPHLVETAKKFCLHVLYDIVQLLYTWNMDPDVLFLSSASPPESESE